jgi:hypothetical protein
MFWVVVKEALDDGVSLESRQTWSAWGETRGYRRRMGRKNLVFFSLYKYCKASPLRTAVVLSNLRTVLMMLVDVEIANGKFLREKPYPLKR